MNITAALAITSEMPSGLFPRFREPSQQCGGRLEHDEDGQEETGDSNQSESFPLAPDVLTPFPFVTQMPNQHGSGEELDHAIQHERNQGDATSGASHEATAI